MTREGKRERLAELKKEAAVLIDVQRSSDVERVTNAIRLGQVLKEAKKLLVWGSFKNWCKAEIGYEKSHCNDAMKLFDYREEIPAAQRWAVEHGIAATTVSDIVKLLPKWKRRDEMPRNPSLPRRRHSVAHITDDHRSKICNAHASLSAQQVDETELIQSEIVLLRLAVAYDVSIDRLFRAVRLQAPPRWEARVKKEAFGQADVADGIEAPVMGGVPELRSTVPPRFSVLSEVPASEAVSIQGPPASSMKAKNPLSFRPIGSQRYRSLPAFNRLSTGKRASRKMCETGLRIIIELGRSGTSYTRIFHRLKALDLKASSAQISSVLIRAKNA